MTRFGRPQPESVEGARGSVRADGSFERWLRSHRGPVVVSIIAVALGIRLFAIRGTYLGGDEAVHFQLVNVSSVVAVYRETLTNAHPPLFFFLLHFWRLIDTSEFFLRLLPALLGSALPGVTYLWADRLFGKSAAFFALNLFAFSPALVFLSAEVRGYALLLFLMVSALLVLERAIERRSSPLMAGFSGLLYLAILTHYSALWFTLAVAGYVLVRIRAERLPPGLIMTWLGFEVGAAILYAFLYVTHLAILRGGELERDAMDRGLRAEYFHSAQESVLDFLARQTRALFGALLGSPAAAVGGLAAVVAGIALLVWRRRPAAWLLALPFVLGGAAGLAGLYPYGGTRHSFYLLPFAAAAIGVAVAAATRGRLWPALLLSVLLASLSLSQVASRRRDLVQMKAAIQTIRATAPAGSLLFADCHSGLILSYYLGGSDFYRENPRPEHFWRSSAGGYQLIGSPVWAFNPNRFSSELRRLIEEYRLPAGQALWVVHIGWEIDPALVLSQQHAVAALPHRFQFGEIAIVEARLP